MQRLALYACEVSIQRCEQRRLFSIFTKTYFSSSLYCGLDKLSSFESTEKIRSWLASYYIRKSDGQQKKCEAGLQKYAKHTFYWSVFTFSHFHWLNVLWSWGSEIPGVSVRASVCVSVYLSVCVSVRARTPKLPGWFQWNFPKMIPSRSICARLSFSSLS